MCVCVCVCIRARARVYARLSVLGINVRSTLHVAIVSKAARLSQRCLNLLDTAEVVTMMSNDIERIVEFVRLMYQTLLSPLAIIGIVGLLFYVRRCRHRCRRQCHLNDGSETHTHTHTRVCACSHGRVTMIFYVREISRARTDSHMVLNSDAWMNGWMHTHIYTHTHTHARTHTRARPHVRTNMYSQILGLSFFAGLAVILVGLLVNGLIFLAIASRRKKQVASTEERIRCFDDMLSGMKILKCMTWEGAAQEFSSVPRKKELHLGSHVVVLQSVQISVFLFTAPVGLLLSFVVYIARGNELTPAIILSTIALLSALRVPMIAFPMSLAYMIQARVAVRRISDFLNREERREARLFTFGRDGTRSDGEDSTILPVAAHAISERGKFADEEDEDEAVEEDDSYMRDRYTVNGSEFVSARGRGDEEECAFAISMHNCTLSWTATTAEAAPAPAKSRFVTGATTDTETSSSRWSIEGNADSDHLSEGGGRGSCSGSSSGHRSDDDDDDRGGTDGFLLADITLHVKRRELVCVVGDIGGGKTSLLNAILGELGLVRGSRVVNDACVLVPQTPWSFDGSVRENIIMGREFHRARYEQALWSVDLHHDVASWPDGDETKMASVREHFSGGQLVRINIARAAYSTEPTVLLDESLVGLDASVLRKVFVRCIQGMMGDRTRVLVSKDAHVIRMADRIVVVDQGRICQDLSRHDLHQMKRLRAEEDVATALLRMTHGAGQRGGGGGDDDDTGRSAAVSSRQQNRAHRNKVHFKENDDDDTKTVRDDFDLDERQATITSRTARVGAENVSCRRRARLGLSSRAAPPPSVTPLGTPFRVPWDILETTRQALTSGRHKSHDVQPPTQTSRQHRREHSMMTTTSEVDDYQMTTYRSYAVSTWRHHHQAMDNMNVAAVRSPPGANAAMENPLIQPTRRGEDDVEDLAAAHESLYRATWQTYAVYLSRGGVIEWAFVVALILSAQISIAVAEFLLSRWAQSQLDSGGNSSESSTYLTLYGTIVVVYAGCLLMASLIQAVVAYRASSAIYQRLLRSSFFATMAFFYQISVGQLLSLYTRDVDVLDIVLVPTINLFLVTAANMIGASTIVIISLPYLVILVLFYFSAFAALLLYFRALIQQLMVKEMQRRVEMTTFMNTTASRMGIVMLRSYKCYALFAQRIRNAVNEYARCMWHIALLNSNVGVLLEVLGLLLVTVSFAVAIGLRESIGPARVALVVTNAWLVSCIAATTAEVFAQIDQHMQSVERIVQFTNTMPQEKLEPRQMRCDTTQIRILTLPVSQCPCSSYYRAASKDNAPAR